MPDPETSFERSPIQSTVGVATDIHPFTIGYTPLTSGERRRVYTDGERSIAVLDLSMSVPPEKCGCTCRMLLPPKFDVKTRIGRIQPLRYQYTAESGCETGYKSDRISLPSRFADHTHLAETVSRIEPKAHGRACAIPYCFGEIFHPYSRRERTKEPIRASKTLK